LRAARRRAGADHPWHPKREKNSDGHGDRGASALPVLQPDVRQFRARKASSVSEQYPREKISDETKACQRGATASARAASRSSGSAWTAPRGHTHTLLAGTGLLTTRNISGGSRLPGAPSPRRRAAHQQKTRPAGVPILPSGSAQHARDKYV